MDFSVKSLADRKVRYFDSKEDSEIQILFVPGIFNAEVWRHQIKYFSKNYRTITFRREDKDYQDQKDIIKSILRNKDIDNAVLVSAGPANSLIQEFEGRKDVIATVLTSPASEYPKVTQNKYSFFKFTAFRKAKLAQKTFFDDKTDYGIVKDFLDDFELPEYELLSTFLENFDMRSPIKNALVVHPEEDRFSSRDFACSMKPEAKISLIQSAGCFSFYEKPEEYNKAVHDFLRRLEDFVESKKVRETREKNRTLSDFESDQKSEYGSQRKQVIWK